MKIGYVVNRGHVGTDALLAEVAARLTARGHRVAGLVQTNTDRDDGCRCDMDVQVLPSGETFRISQYRGPGARGCRLDPSMLEASVALVSRALADAPDLLILNKFGKHEAEGRGHRETIAAALDMGLPVLLGVSPLNYEAFHAFAGDMAEEVICEAAKLVAWVETALGANNRAETGQEGPALYL